MTIRLLTAWSIYPNNTLLTLDAASEASLVAQHIADTTLTGGVVFTPTLLAAPLLGSARGTLAQMLALAPTAGAYFHTTDSKTTLGGAVLPEGNDWVGDGTLWQPRGNQVVYRETSIVTGAKQVAEQIIKTIAIQPGLFYGHRVQLDFEIGKNGTTDICSQCNVRLGPAGSVADGYLAQTAFNVLPAAKRSAGYSNQFEFPTTAAQAQKHGTGGGIDNGSFGSTAGGTALGTMAVLTGANFKTTVQQLTFAMVMAAATVDSPQIGAVYLTLLA